MTTSHWGRACYISWGKFCQWSITDLPFCLQQLIATGQRNPSAANSPLEEENGPIECESFRSQFADGT